MSRHAKVLSALAGILLLGTVMHAGEEVEFTAEFPLEECRFVDSGRNPYFSLNPGDRLWLEADEDGEMLELQITVLNDRRWIRVPLDEGEWKWVRARVIEEREWVDGALREVSRNFYARCRQTDDIYYFGEEVDIYGPGGITHDGAWRAGVKGARPGIIMPGSFLLGSRYYQELAPNVALDRAEHVALGLEVEVPAGDLDDCVEIVETTPLEPGHQSLKVYCEGIGLVMDGDAELVNYDIDDYDDD